MQAVEFNKFNKPYECPNVQTVETVFKESHFGTEAAEVYSG